MNMRQAHRGAAMVTVVMRMTSLAAIVASVMLIAANQRTRAASSARAIVRQTCADAGLQFARSFFASKQSQWDLLLAKPTSTVHPYNPIKSTWNTIPADPNTDAGVTDIKAITTPVKGISLFVDLDGLAGDDVYIYIRDNDDEMLPATSDWGRDNDQNVIVGAICISSTMSPRRQDGTLDTDKVSVESVLSFNALINTISSQSTQGPSGSGNIN